MTLYGTNRLDDLFYMVMMIHIEILTTKKLRTLSMVVNLLIIGADSPFRKNLANRLEFKRNRIIIAGRETEVKKIIRKTDIDVCLIDLTALKREGIKLLEYIKSKRPSTEIIIINSSEQMSLSIEGMKRGAFDDFLVPFNMDDLVRRIAEAYEKKIENEKK